MTVFEQKKFNFVLNKEEQKILQDATQIIDEICNKLNSDECPIFEYGLDETRCPFYGICSYQRYSVQEKFKESWESSIFHEMYDIKIDFE